MGLLTRQLPAVEAGETLQASLAAMVPHLQERDRRSFLRDLRRQAEPIMPRVREPIIEMNPVLAAQWFAEQGIQVQGSNGGE